MFSQTITKFPPPRAVATRHLNTARHYTLPYLFVLSLTTLILAVIYTYCVGQNNHARAEILNSPSTTSNTSYPAPPNHHERRLVGYAAPHLFPRMSTTNATSPASSTKSPVTHQSSVALIFYSITLPLTTLLHASIEAIMLKFWPQLLTHSAKSPINIPYLLLTTTILQILGWATTSAFWTHCELALTDSNMCPPPVRNHLMYGILELSIAKSAIGWLLVVGYVAHAFFLVRWMRVVKRWEGISGWASRLEWEPEDKEGMDLGDLGGMEDVRVKGAVSAITVVAAAQEARIKHENEERKRKDVEEKHGPPKVAPVFPPPPTKPRK